MEGPIQPGSGLPLRPAFFKPLGVLTLLAMLALGGALPGLLSISHAQLLWLVRAGIVLLVVLQLSWFVPSRLRESFVWQLVLPVSALLCGLCANGWQLDRLISSQLSETLEGLDLPLEIIVDSLPDTTSGQIGSQRSTSFYARVAGSSNEADGLLGRRIRLNWYQPPDNVRPGQHWQLIARLKRPRGMVNPGGFDYQAWLLARGIVASGYVRAGSDATLLQVTETAGFNLWRQQINQHFFAADIPHSALFKALITGDKSAITQPEWRVLRDTGTVHLMAISGLHVGLVALLGFFLGTALVRMLVWLRPTGNRWLAPLLAVLAAAVYAGLAGFSIPTQRALVMVVLFSLAMATGRRVNYWQVFWIAVVAVLLLDPLAPRAAGFWLSFSAVSILVYLFSWRRYRKRRILDTLRAQLWLLPALAVPLSLLALPVVPASPLANLVAVPVVSLMIVPGLLLGLLVTAVSPAAGVWIMQLLGCLFDWLWRYLEMLAGISWQWQPAAVHMSVSTLLAATLGLLLALSPLGLRLRFCGAALLLVVLQPADHAPAGLRLTTLDVQQGLALAVETPGHALVYDTGARYSDDFDMGSRVLVPYLQQQGVEHLDLLVVSHGDNDHAGGTGSVLSRLPPEHLLAGEPLRQPVADSDVETVRARWQRREACHQGQHFQMGELEIDVIWPAADATGPAIRESNNASCVLLLTWGQVRILLPGDIESPVEHELLALPALQSPVDVLIVPHHGSRTSSSIDLLARLQPAVAVFSVGYRNRYHHPNARVLERYRQGGSRILRTDLDGALTLEWSVDGVASVRAERRAAVRPWYTTPADSEISPPTD